jgi:hypothetical protein
MKLEEYECVKTKRRAQARISPLFSIAVGVSARFCRGTCSLMRLAGSRPRPMNLPHLQDCRHHWTVDVYASPANSPNLRNFP